MVISLFEQPLFIQQRQIMARPIQVWAVVAEAQSSAHNPGAE
jgi:hypothetical protein